MKDLKDQLQSIGMKSGRDDLFRSILSDAPLLSKLRLLGLSDQAIADNLPLVSAFQDSEHVCGNCPGLKDCPKDFAGTKMDLLWKDGKLSSQWINCPRNDALNNPIYQFFFRDFPEEWLDKNKFSLARSRRAVLVIKSFLSIRDNPEHPWLYLVGEKGSGKSFLAFNMAYSYAANGHSVSYLSTPTRFQMLKELSYKERASFDDLMVRFATVDLLVLDDFGEEYHSDFVRDTLLSPLLVLRDKNRLLTLFVSEKSPKAAALRYAYNAENREKALELSSLIEKNLSDGRAVEVAKGFETYLSNKKG